jgi:Asp-tRNA(Asn)/Glu-tRNA(Gln) amidotransferase A subunit family amidase
MGHPDRPLWSLSARELALAYAGGLSPEDVMAATLARIDEINPELNAIVTLDAVAAT